MSVSSTSGAPPPSREARRRRLAVWVAVVVALLLVAAGLVALRLSRVLAGSGSDAATAMVLQSELDRPAPDVAREQRPAPEAAPPLAGDSPEEPRLWQRRLARAEAILHAYVESTRYPATCRPAYEEPDQIDLPAPERSFPLDRDDPDDPEGVRIRARQSAVFVAGEESVAFEVSCEGGKGEPVPCTVEGYTQPADHYGTGVPPVRLDFAADAEGARWSATLTPARDGFADVEGTLRTSVRVAARGDERMLFFDVLFTPRPPARFTGQVHEWLEQGSLVVAPELEVERPGRYVVTGRFDGADGEPLAVVTFNEELEAGLRLAPLVVFGKLVRDFSPAFPLGLRDVVAFRLREEGDPDRELLPTEAGQVYTTRTYPLDAFSDQEWQSEERDRYVRELTSDVDRAREKAPP